MKKSGLFTVAYLLFGILILSVVMLSFARQDRTSEPSIASFGPSGLRVFAELLRQDGYEVAETLSLSPRLKPNDAIVLISREESMEELISSESKAHQAKVKALRTQHLALGGVVIDGAIARDFGQATLTAEKNPLPLESPNQAKSATISSAPSSVDPGFDADEPSTPIWTNFASVAVLDKGLHLTIDDVIGATNRFIDRQQNAEVFLALVHGVVPKGGRVVFVESSWSIQQEPGFFADLGPWAAAGWAQLIFLGVVIAYSLGKPFGLPSEGRTSQRGQRDLVDAITGTFRRAQATPIAMSALLTDADRRLRHFLKLPPGADVELRNKALPESLLKALWMVENASRDRVPPDVALGISRKLESELRAFVGERRIAPRRRRRG